ncbi:phosphate/phosphite/phosphonate ABC transporter substrate-binding protein [Okeanomitos corallinicola TIOX110]|uniref:Phosphate/phosphite/phosphonate ABC transporter substrate-binding protein n=1 Tax=Okeanomitos corallinicola TIOX110 TaxID=3133117 RepID=A0ABZ2UXM8_9CYAN
MKYIRFQQIAPVIKPSLVLITLFCLSTLSFSCTPTTNNNSGNNTEAKTETHKNQLLEIAVNPWQSAKEQDEKFAPLTAYLQEKIQRPVKFEVTKNYQTAVDLLVKEEVDMGYLGALSYIKCHERNPNIQPLVMPIDQKTGRPWYTGVIVTKSDPKINSLADLKGKRFAFVSPSSTSGFLMPMMGLKEQNIDPNKDFTKILYSGSHDKTEADLVKGVVDAIAVDKISFLRSQETGKLPATKYKIIWESPPIPMASIVINTKKFSSEELSLIRQVLIDAPVGILDVSGSASAGYTLAKDTDFDTIRQIYTQFKLVQIPAK